MMPLWRGTRSLVKELIYPRLCMGCGMRGTWLCDGCAASLPRLDRGICFRCGAPVTPGACQFCRQLAPTIDRARAVYPYHGWAGAAVRSFKYQSEWDRGTDLGSRMIDPARSFGGLDAIVPVPLHRSRLDWRGYNQAAILAEGIGASLGVPVMPLLERVRETGAQVHLDREARLANLDRAFALSPEWSLKPGSRILLVDDVRTTSATLNDAARALQRTGPAAVYALTFALDIPKTTLDAWLAES
ncbi:MAG TPA: ComF family protein [Thermomicrobiales bacterium]|nr:ComF family protein [Thermomicrobiales bacterium]